jgi:RNA polymerase sigma factor (sigma-70 family)
MPADEHKPKISRQEPGSAEVARRDERLVRGVLAGDHDCLDTLMTHYDSLIRFAIFKTSKSECQRDPQFLDARASEVWIGFVQTIQRTSQPPTGTLAAYLTQIARNKCFDALRAKPVSPTPNQGARQNSDDIENIQDTRDDPLTIMITHEQLTQLRISLAELSESDKKMVGQIEWILAGKWKTAASSLQIAESTLRSRWKRMTDQIRSKM